MINSSNRLHNLDYLRGIAAFGIMIYHYFLYTQGTWAADTFLGRIGIYGVSIFYVLSGLTLFYVYHDKMDISAKSLTAFFKKRFFRIFPLLWLIILLSIVISKKVPDWEKLALNLSGLFGFVSWDDYYGTGVWSIGNELVFYVFFPFFILFARRYKMLLAITGILLFSIYSYFAFNVLNTKTDLAVQWRNYVNPLNQVFLFFGGFLIGYLFHTKIFNNKLIVILLILSLSVFVFYPVDGNQINLVTGINRIVLTGCCFLISFCFFKWQITLPKMLHNPLAILGESSYSVYLVHPIIWTVITVFSKYIFVISDPVKIVLSVLLTLVSSYFIYQKFEKFFMKLGRKTSVY